MNYFDKALACTYLVMSLPLWLVLFIAIKLSSKGPFIFKQRRIGKDMKIFTIYKFRTMVENAENLKTQFKNNQRDSNLKYLHDNRFTGIGRFISSIGIDEIPQLVNVLKGEMALVGPRPIPVSDSREIPNKYKIRFSVLPGITSPGKIVENRKIKFEEWMQNDVEYVKQKSVRGDLYIFFLTHKFIMKSIHRNILKKNK